MVINTTKKWANGIRCARFLLPAVVCNLACVVSQSCAGMSSASRSEAKLHSVVFVTAPTETVARDIGKGLVTNKLAACVNVVPKITSIYEWEGQINEDSEVLMMIKTRTSRVPDLTKYVRQHHPYKVCEIISTNIEDGNLPYLEWISSSVPEL